MEDNYLLRCWELASCNEPKSIIESLNPNNISKMFMLTDLYDILKVLKLC